MENRGETPTNIDIACTFHFLPLSYHLSSFAVKRALRRATAEEGPIAPFNHNKRKRREKISRKI